MIFKVHMLAFMDGHLIRPVEVPDDKLGGPGPSPEGDTATLDAVYHHGQNDFCDDPDTRSSYCSVSAGDVIELHEGRRYLILPMGFRRISEESWRRYLDTPRGTRYTMIYRAEDQ